MQGSLVHVQYARSQSLQQGGIVADGEQAKAAFA